MRLFRRQGGSRPEPEWRASDILALVIAALQVVLPYLFIILGVATATYLLVALVFRA